ILFCRGAGAQTNFSHAYTQNNLQYGFSLKGTLFFDLLRHHPRAYFRIGADVGIASTFIDDWLYPAVNFEIQFYNAGFGTRYRDEHHFGPDFEMLPAFTLTAGWPDRMRQQQPGNRYIPMYYFSNFARPALQNPYLH